MPLRALEAGGDAGVAAKPRGLPQKSIFLVVFLHLLGFTMSGPILPALRDHFGIAAAQTGLITSAFPLGMFVAVFIFPMLSDAIGRKPVLVTSYLCVGIGFALQAFAIYRGLPFGVYLALRAASGACAGATTVVKAYIADTADRESLPRAMAYREAAGTLSYIVGPTLGGILFSVTSLPFVILFSGLASIIAGVWVLFFLRAPPHVADAGAPGQPARRAEGGPHGGPGEAGSAGPAAGAERATCPWLVVATMVCIHFLYNFGQAFFESFFALLCAERLGLQPAVLGPMLTGMACLVFFNSTFTYPRLVRRLGLVPVAILGLLAMAAGLGCLGGSTTLGAVAAAMLLYGFGVPHFTPSVPTVLAQSAPRRKRGLVLGVDSAAGSVSRILSPAVMGIIYQLGPSLAFKCAGGVVLVGAGLMTFQQRRLSQV